MTFMHGRPTWASNIGRQDSCAMALDAPFAGALR